MKFDINIYGTSCFITPHVLKACLSFSPFLYSLLIRWRSGSAQELFAWKAILPTGGLVGVGGVEREPAIHSHDTPPPQPPSHAEAVPQSRPQREYKMEELPIPNARQRSALNTFDLGGI